MLGLTSRDVCSTYNACVDSPNVLAELCKCSSYPGRKLCLGGHIIDRFRAQNKCSLPPPPATCHPTQPTCITVMVVVVPLYLNIIIYRQIRITGCNVSPTARSSTGRSGRLTLCVQRMHDGVGCCYVPGVSLVSLYES